MRDGHAINLGGKLVCSGIAILCGLKPLMEYLPRWMMFSAISPAKKIPSHPGKTGF
jgi:hypothetical protein